MLRKNFYIPAFYSLIILDTFFKNLYAQTETQTPGTLSSQPQTQSKKGSTNNDLMIFIGVFAPASFIAAFITILCCIRNQEIEREKLSKSMYDFIKSFLPTSNLGETLPESLTEIDNNNWLNDTILRIEPSTVDVPDTEINNFLDSVKNDLEHFTGPFELCRAYGIFDEDNQSNYSSNRGELSLKFIKSSCDNNLIKFSSQDLPSGSYYDPTTKERIKIKDGKLSLSANRFSANLQIERVIYNYNIIITYAIAGLIAKVPNDEGGFIFQFMGKYLPRHRGSDEGVISLRKSSPKIS